MSGRTYILLADDDDEYYNDLKEAGERSNVVIEYAKYPEHGVEMLKKRGSKYSGAIIDINGFANQNQTITSEEHLLICIEEFKKIYAELPMLIATHDTQSRDRALIFHIDKQHNMPVVCKNDLDAPEKMFSIIKEKAKNLPKIKYRNEYPDIFEIFDKDYLGSDSLEKVFAIMDGLEADDVTKIQQNLSTFRNLLDEIFKRMAKEKKDVIPENLLDPKIKTGRILGHLRNSGEDGCREVNDGGKTYTRRSAPSLFGSLIKDITDGVSAHQDESTFEFKKPTKYTYRAVFNAMMEYLLWFKDWTEKNQNNDN